jgi:hypothetical protein
MCYQISKYAHLTGLQVSYNIYQAFEKMVNNGKSNHGFRHTEIQSNDRALHRYSTTRECCKKSSYAIEVTDIKKLHHIKFELHTQGKNSREWSLFNFCDHGRQEGQ